MTPPDKVGNPESCVDDYSSIPESPDHSVEIVYSFPIFSKNLKYELEEYLLRRFGDRYVHISRM